MSSAISLNRFRSDTEQLLEKIIKTGMPLEIEYKGKKFIITAAERRDKLANLEPHPECISGDPEDIVHIDWSGEWKHDLP